MHYISQKPEVVFITIFYKRFYFVQSLWMSRSIYSNCTSHVADRISESKLGSNPGTQSIASTSSYLFPVVLMWAKVEIKKLVRVFLNRKNHFKIIQHSCTRIITIVIKSSYTNRHYPLNNFVSKLNKYSMN